jgi:hypothetical protein
MIKNTPHDTLALSGVSHALQDFISTLAQAFSANDDAVKNLKVIEKNIMDQLCECSKADGCTKIAEMAKPIKAHWRAEEEKAKAEEKKACDEKAKEKK